MKCVFIVLDTLRRDYLEAYDNGWVKTPNLSRIARDGVTFDNHWAGSLPCIPARREFMTGRYNFMFRSWGPIEPFDDVLPVELRKRGVFSHLLTDHNHYFELGGENYHTSFDTWEFFRGQEHDPWVSQVDAVALPDNMSAKLNQQNWLNRTRQQAETDFSGPRTAQAAVDWIHTNQHTKGDWFLQVELFDPHEPFYCPDKYREMYGDTWDGPLYDWPNYDAAHESPEAVEHIRKCYAGLLTMTDFWVGKVLDALQATGQWDDTLVIFTTDHGTMLTEHGYWMKNYMPVFKEIAHLPLIIKTPNNQHAGQRVSALTQTIDVMPTILDFFGCPPTPHAHGASLCPTFEGKAVRDGAIFGYFGMATNYTDGQLVYMRNPVNADGGPLHAYTAMPIGGLNQWYPRDLNEKMEMGRYFGHTYNLPLYKIPATGQAARTPEGDFLTGQHQLFDLDSDPQQENPLPLPSDTEAHCIKQLSSLLQKCEAPEEQFTRLGLTPLK